MPARLSALVIWVLLAGSVVFWALRLGVGTLHAPPHTATVDTTAPVRGSLARLLGAPDTAVTEVAAAPADSRFRLIGVMAPRPSAAAGHGVALISIDGKAPRAFRVGTPLEDDLVLQNVGMRSASIGPPQGEAQVRLELPPLPEPATGSLSPAVNGDGGASPRENPRAAAAPPVRRPAPRARPDNGQVAR